MEEGIDLYNFNIHPDIWNGSWDIIIQFYPTPSYIQWNLVQNNKILSYTMIHVVEMGI